MTEHPKNYGKPECFEPIRKNAAQFIMREKFCSGISAAVLAERLQRNPHTVSCNLFRIASFGKAGAQARRGYGLPYLFRIVEALGYDV